ncbi:GILT-like protein 2 [Epargyreus clarus]|uniref:GILT-like protein 2 n=1 Tax=Epargyreus clarus TaxID=520877 RepID=UPI003C305F28
MLPSNRVLFQISIALCFIASYNGEIVSNINVQHITRSDNYVRRHYKQPYINTGDVVNIQLYYECLCGDCRHFDTTQFKTVVVQLNKYLNIRTYPYGNAMTIDDNGKYKFKCQHGPSECYGNMLHACALDVIKNQTQALLYNSCMMDFNQKNRGSDDIAAEECGESMKIDADPIKACAKGDKGAKLLKHYGDESQKAHFQYVPYILVNGKESNGSNFMKDVCAAFADPPPPCIAVL